MRRSPSPPNDVSQAHCRRLLEAMGQAVADKGYAAVTIADVVAAARVSKRTFYEHFQDKADCVLALHAAATGSALAALRRAVDPQRHWHAQVEGALAAYFATLGTSPTLLRTMFIEILGLGPAGLDARRRAVVVLADFVVEAVLAGRQPPPAARRHVALLATALVGGIHELIVQAIEEERADRLADLSATVGPLVRAMGDAIEAAVRTDQPPAR